MSDTPSQTRPLTRPGLIAGALSGQKRGRAHPAVLVPTLPLLFVVVLGWLGADSCSFFVLAVADPILAYKAENAVNQLQVRLSPRFRPPNHLAHCCMSRRIFQLGFSSCMHMYYLPLTCKRV